MHAAEFTHRDLKPANIFVIAKPPAARTWAVKIGDFGISKRVRTQNTALRTTIGTPHYQAPEIIDDERETSSYSEAVDVWSLGCVIFKLVTGETPFERPHVDVMKYCKDISLFPGKTLMAKLNSDGTSFLRCLLQPEPDNRPSAGDALTNKWVVTELNSLNDVQDDSALGRLSSEVPAPTQNPFRSEYARSTATIWQARVDAHEIDRGRTSPSRNVDLKSPTSETMPESRNSGVESLDPTYVRVQFQFQPSEAGELSLGLGDVIQVLFESEYWSYGRLEGTEGWFPSSYCRSISKEEAFLNSVTTVSAEYGQRPHNIEQQNSSTSSRPFRPSNDWHEQAKKVPLGSLNFYRALFSQTSERIVGICDQGYCSLGIDTKLISFPHSAQKQSMARLEVLSFSFSPNGQLVASGGAVNGHGAISFYDADIQLIGSIDFLELNAITHVSFDYGNKYFAACSAHGEVHIWDAPGAELIEALRSDATANLRG